MIICSCTGATDAQVLSCVEHPRTGTLCKGCGPVLRELRGTIPDCPLCLGKGDSGNTLYGMSICWRCTRETGAPFRLSVVSGASHVASPAARWCVQVHRHMMTYGIPVRSATRLLHAELAGLEVDITDLT